MTLIGWTQVLVFCVLVLALAKPLGAYMTRVFNWPAHPFVACAATG